MTDPTQTAKPSVRQLRLVVEATDQEAAVRFFRDVLGMPEIAAYADDDDVVAILDAGRATLEIGTPGHRRALDQLEADGREGARIRVALEVDDSVAATDAAVAAGAELIAAPRETPWGSLNSRLAAPADLEVTLFQELGEAETFTSGSAPRQV